jgi:S-adenosylmethionine:tRNA ribosyltransferase-isomerase
MLVSEFHYDLPPERIAQEPLPDRAGSRLLHVTRQLGRWQDRSFREFPALLRPDDLLVVNNTRVFPARLFGHRSGERAQAVGQHNPAAREYLRGQVEVLLTRRVTDDPNSNDQNDWGCLVRPGRKIGIGEKLYFGDPPALEAEVIERGNFGERRIRFAPVDDFMACLDRIGHVPLPPYIHREHDRDGRAADRDMDKERYQTVYAQAPGSKAGSVAAPTAGLHFTPEILAEIRERGIEIAEIALHVGLGTFQPVRVERVEDHKLHRERYEISAEAAQAINQAKIEGRRVVAVGTTTVRTLEHAAEFATKLAGKLSEERTRGVPIEAGRGDADVFLYPGHRFRIVDALLTNFHLPQSTLLMLVCALGGKDLVMDAYRHAVEAGYRFYSYGDCMFVE